MNEGKSLDDFMMSPDRIPSLDSEIGKLNETMHQRTEVINALSGLGDNPEAAGIVNSFKEANTASEKRIAELQEEVNKVKAHNNL